MKQILFILIFFFNISCSEGQSVEFKSTLSKLEIEEEPGDPIKTIYTPEVVNFKLTRNTLTIDSLKLAILLVSLTNDDKGEEIACYKTSSNNLYYIHVLNGEIIKIIFESKVAKIIYLNKELKRI